MNLSQQTLHYAPSTGDAGKESAGKIIVITAPSGAGKTSITHFLLKKFPQLKFSVSTATRKPRPNEVDGRDYYFVSESEFRNKIKAAEFVEWEMVYEGKYYGTLKSELRRLWDSGKVPLLDIDVKGAIHVQEQYPDSSLSLFIEPPSIKELSKRLLSRGTETEESLQARINKAEYELTFMRHFDKIIVNDELADACAEAEKWVRKFLQVKPA
jgi:guanylate kinase